LTEEELMAAQNVLATQITAGALIAFVVNFVKQSKYFPWISEETKTLSTILAAFLAAATAVGVNAVWNPTEHTLLISGLTLAGISAAVWAFAKQYVMQHLAGKVMFPSPQKLVPVNEEVAKAKE
jgi:hypothetical protein